MSIANKKEVPLLAKKWNTSVNGAKKWIKNNLPDHFNQIYDNSLLVKNQKKEYYYQISSLQYENFKINHFMQEHKLIKAHNKELYEKIAYWIDCKFCVGKTRFASKRKNKAIYRCLNCDKGFVI